MVFSKQEHSNIEVAQQCYATSGKKEDLAVMEAAAKVYFNAKRTYLLANNTYHRVKYGDI